MRSRLLMLITLVVLSAVPAAAMIGVDDLHYDVHLTGTVTELSYELGDFLLRDRSGDNVVIADAATVQTNQGKFGTLADLKDRAIVRVFGNRLSPHTVYAKVIIVFDDTGKFVDLSLNAPSYLAGDDVEMDGIVTHVSVYANSITFHTRYGSYTVSPRLDTFIGRGAYRTDIYDVFRGDRIRVSGRLLAPGLIDADSIQMLESCCFGGASTDRFWSIRFDMITGVIIEMPRRPMWAFTVRTPWGVRSVRLALPSSQRDSTRMASLEDLKTGAMVQLTGLWDAETLVANRFAVMKIEEDKTTKDDKKSGKEEAPSGQKTTKPVQPKTNEQRVQR
jgi:hypothetical protein